MAETIWGEPDLHKAFGEDFSFFSEYWRIILPEHFLSLQVFDVVFAADETLFKHGDIQVAKKTKATKVVLLTLQ